MSFAFHISLWECKSAWRRSEVSSKEINCRSNAHDNEFWNQKHLKLMPSTQVQSPLTWAINGSLCTDTITLFWTSKVTVSFFWLLTGQAKHTEVTKHRWSKVLLQLSGSHKLGGSALHGTHIRVNSMYVLTLSQLPRLSFFYLSATKPLLSSSKNASCLTFKLKLWFYYFLSHRYGWSQMFICCMLAFCFCDSHILKQNAASQLVFFLDRAAMEDLLFF